MKFPSFSSCSSSSSPLVFDSSCCFHATASRKDLCLSWPQKNSRKENNGKRHRHDKNVIFHSVFLFFFLFYSLCFNDVDDDILRRFSSLFISAFLLNSIETVESHIDSIFFSPFVRSFAHKAQQYRFIKRKESNKEKNINNNENQFSFSFSFLLR
jgi:hypothetical protein